MSALVDELQLALSATSGGKPLERYLHTLQTSFDTHPPPYGQAWYGERFRAFARDTEWLAHCLLLNAQVEGKGAKSLWEIAPTAAEPFIQDAIRQHAIDEAKHAKMYVRICDLLFPSAIPKELREDVEGLSPGYGPSDMPAPAAAVPFEKTWDQLIQMNIGEIRTRVNQLVMRPILLALAEGGPEEGRIRKILDMLMVDETKHILYTAELIERFCRGGAEDFVQTVSAYRTREFNGITLNEVTGQDSSEAYAGS